MLRSEAETTDVSSICAPMIKLTASTARRSTVHSQLRESFKASTARGMIFALCQEAKFTISSSLQLRGAS